MSNLQRPNQLFTLVDIIRSKPNTCSINSIKVNNTTIYKIGNISHSIAKFITTIYASNNYIEDINDIKQFQSIQVLTLANNLINHLTDLNVLQFLPNLEKLSLEGNPCSFIPFYREYVICHCPKLQLLDNMKITSIERQYAIVLYKKLSSIFDQMKLNHANIYLLFHFHQIKLCIQEMKSSIFPKFR